MTLIEILVIWHFIGACIWFVVGVFDGSPVNYFGAGFLALLINLICPIASLGYWFYKLCTVGRR